MRSGAPSASSSPGRALEAVTALERIGRDGDLTHAEPALAVLERELSRLGPALASLTAGGRGGEDPGRRGRCGSFRRVLADHLESWGHEVTRPSTAPEAWELFQQGHFPVVISDWMMPGWTASS